MSHHFSGASDQLDGERHNDSLVFLLRPLSLPKPICNRVARSVRDLARVSYHAPLYFHISCFPLSLARSTHSLAHSLTHSLAHSVKHNRAEESRYTNERCMAHSSAERWMIGDDRKEQVSTSIAILRRRCCSFLSGRARANALGHALRGVAQVDDGPHTVGRDGGRSFR